jgi:transposase
MSKYSEQFKLSLVRQYLSGSGGLKFIAQEHGIDHSQFGRWVSAYKQHGISGLQKKRAIYSVEFKLTVLEHMRFNDLSQDQTAALFDIRSPAHIGMWKRSYDQYGLDGLIRRPKGRSQLMNDSPSPKKINSPVDDASRSHEDLLAEVNQLRMENAYLKKLRALVQEKQQVQLKKQK